MNAKIIDGRKLATIKKEEIRSKIMQRSQQGLATPGLSVILVGDDPASKIYVQNKQKAAHEVGIQSQFHHLTASTSQKELTNVIEELNVEKSVHGILLQLPLPNHFQAEVLLDKINYLKDVDGFHPCNLGRLAQRRPLLRPCTPYGIMQLLHSLNMNLAGKHAVVVGASNIVGRPMALELLLAKCTITICHRFTQNLEMHVNDADILVAAIGKPGVIQSDWIKPGAIVIDVGINRRQDGSITGDIDFTSASTRAGWITPVPGGVGPMTVATLLQNTLLCAELLE